MLHIRLRAPARAVAELNRSPEEDRAAPAGCQWGTPLKRGRCGFRLSKRRAKQNDGRGWPGRWAALASLRDADFPPRLHTSHLYDVLGASHLVRSVGEDIDYCIGQLEEGTPIPKQPSWKPANGQNCRDRDRGASCQGSSERYFAESSLLFRGSNTSPPSVIIITRDFGDGVKTRVK